MMNVWVTVTVSKERRHMHDLKKIVVKRMIKSTAGHFFAVSFTSRAKEPQLVPLIWLRST